MTFWDHLDVLRGVLLRCAAAFLVCSVGAFLFKEQLFDGVVFAPLRGNFPLYRMTGTGFSLSLVNIGITSQLFVHMRVAAVAGLLVSMPYILFELWRFVAPALYEKERKRARAAFLSASVLFYAGVAFSYFFILPLTLVFFGSYSVSEAVTNTISLDSYISLFAALTLLMGLVFEFPALVAVMAKIGIVSREGMVRYRRHAVVGIVVVAALIAPGDPVSLAVVTAPLYLLYELSILMLGRKKKI